MNILAAAFCHHEVPTHHHVVAFRHILLKDGIILYSFRQEIISSGDKCTISIYETDVHDHFCFRILCDFLYIDIQMTAFLGHKVSAHCHPIAFRYILLKYGIVLDSFWYEIVSSGYNFVSILELDVHDNCLSIIILFNMDILAAAFCHHEVPAYHHVVAFRHILVKDGIILYSFRQEIISSGDKGTVSIHEADVHDHFCFRILCDFLYIDIQMTAFLGHKVSAYRHPVAFRYILVKDGIILDSFRQEIISSGDKRIVSIYKPNIHNDRGRFLANLLYAYIQMTAFLGHKVAAYCHPVTFRYILLKYGIVLDSFRYSVVSSSYDFVSVLELDIHGYIRADFLDTYY